VETPFRLCAAMWKIKSGRILSIVRRTKVASDMSPERESVIERVHKGASE
jgi:hypothetical protein